METPSAPVRKVERKGGAEPKRVGALPRLIVGLLFFIGLAAVAVFVSTSLMLIANDVPFFHPDRDLTQLNEYQFLELLKAGKVETIVNETDPAAGSHTLAGTYRKPDDTTTNAPVSKARYRVPLSLEESANLVMGIEHGDYGAPRAVETRIHTPVVRPLLELLMPVFAGLVIGLLGFYLLYRILTDFLLATHRSV